MLRLRLAIECAPRTKNGQPAHSPTVGAKTSCTQFDCDGLRGCQPNRCPPISSATMGSVSNTPIQNRRVMSVSSGFGPVSAVGVSGSSAMPQIGQEPGPSCRTTGCIGQVKIVPVGIGAPGAGADGSRYFSGSDANLARQPPEQKKYETPPWLWRCGVFTGSTVMPQTGSLVSALAVGGAVIASIPII